MTPQPPSEDPVPIDRDPTSRGPQRGNLQLLQGGKPEACRQVEERLGGYADAALPPEEAALVAAHLKTCASCSEDVRSYRQILAGLRTAAEMNKPLHSKDFWNDLQRSIAAEVAQLPAARPAQKQWWKRPAARWSALAVAALLIASLVGPAADAWREAQPADAAAAGRAVYGSASELIPTDRNFVSDLAASEEDPVQTVEDLEELEDIDLDALGTALDDEPKGEQGA